MSERYANWKPAPSLARVGGDLQRDFLAARLKSPAHAHPGSRMPEFEFTDDEVGAIVAALRSIATTQPQLPALEEPSAGRRKRDVFEPSATTGRRLVKELGCLACHTLDGVGLGARFAGGSLDQAGFHRSRVSLARWLDPSVSGHRPSLRLRPAEREHIVHYLISRSVEENDDPTDSDTPEDRQVARGLSLIRAARCGACHELPGDSPTEATTPLHSGRAIDWIASCLEKPSATNRTQKSNVRRPYYILTAEEQRSIRSFLTTLRPETVVSLFERGRRVVREAGCLHCHRRGPSLGLVEVIPQIAFGEESLRGLEGALRPPSMSAVGDKFADRSRISEVIVGHAPERRPWLRVRMPRYRNLPPREATALAAYLVASDFVPEVESSPHLPPEIPSGDLYAAGHHLVGGRGFGCSSCHALGSYTPKGVAPNVQGPNLKSIGQWLRKPFFLRWMRDPSRIVPGVEMPTVPAGMSPLLAGRLDRQMEALWFGLNSEKFSPPPAFNFVREVDPLPGGEAVVVRDVFRHREPYGDGWTARAFAVGFPTGQHVLYDLDWLTPRSWWAGQFASEFTSGKTWLWEPAGTPILPHLAPLPPIALRTTDGTLLFPTGDEQVIGVFKGWRRVMVDGVEISYALRFASGSSSTSSVDEESGSEQETLDV
ncbi:MAG: hypothetical protein MK538_00965, partial [Planctomycetes bacterium]|nr:hypothetical protein [Planctomycetota bacterium]